MTKKILVIKLWAIGEVALSTPCLSALKGGFPDSDIYFLVGDNARDILVGNPDIKKIYGVNESIFLKPDLSGLFRLLMDLRKEKFDVIITLHYFSLFSVFALLIGAPKRFGFRRPGSWSLNTADIISSGAQTPKIFEYLKVLELLPVKEPGESNARIAVCPGESDKKHVKSLMKEHSLEPKRFIILSPTGGENPAASRFNSNIRNKLWPVEYYKKLCELILKTLDYKVVIIGGETEKKRASYIKGISDGRIVDLCGRTNLRELTLLAKEAAMSVTNDSGPMFLLSSSESPVIAIFGPTNPDLVCCYSGNIIIIREKISCSPCNDESVFPNRIRDCKDAVCMKDVKPERVFQKICEVLKTI